MKNKVVLVTGASSGLGKALAIAFAKRGARLFLVARRGDRLEEVAKECLEKGAVEVCSHVADLSYQESCKSTVDACVALYSGLDLLVNNVGATMWVSFKEVKNPMLFYDMVRVNMASAVFMTQYALAYLRNSFGGILVVSSVQGLFGAPFHTFYSMTKHALNGFFQALRIEEDKITITVVCPSWISGTEIRSSALERVSNGGKSSESEKGLNVDYVAEKSIKAFMNKKALLVLPRWMCFLALLNILFPKLVDYGIKKVVKEH